MVQVLRSGVSVLVLVSKVDVLVLVLEVNVLLTLVILLLLDNHLRMLQMLLLLWQRLLAKRPFIGEW